MGNSQREKVAKTKGDKASKINLREAVSIGIGGMVGGGIFAVLGLSVDLAGGAVPLSFTVAGIIALLTSYSYSKLSVAFPDAGGTVRFINEGLGRGWVSGGLNNMLWVSYIIMLALYSSAFGAYASSLIPLTGDPELDSHIFISAIILVSTAINYYSISVVGEVEAVAVVIKLLILLVFVAVGLYFLPSNPEVTQLSPSNWESPLKWLAGGMVIFVAYEGFELIANSSPDIEKPKKNIPKAFFISVLFVIGLYLAIALVTVGSLSFDKIAAASDYALAEAAKPIFGQLGFTVISIAAMISTFSAINATLLGGSRVNFDVAKEREMPREFTHLFWGKPVGLAFISGAALILANTVDLESISTAGSAGFLVLFAMVNYTSGKLSHKISSNKLISILGMVLCFLAFAILVFQQFTQNPIGIGIAMGLFGLCFVGEIIYRTRGLKKEYPQD